MIVAISGSHGTGKSTLARWMAEHYGVPLLSERARDLLSSLHDIEKVSNDLEAFKRFQVDIIDSQWALDMELCQSNPEGYVVDRPYTDSLAYVAERFASERCWDYDWYDWYERTCLERQAHLAQKYNYRVIYLQWSKELHQKLASDPLRPGNRFWAESIDRHISVGHTNAIRAAWDASFDYVRAIYVSVPLAARNDAVKCILRDWNGYSGWGPQR